MAVTIVGEDASVKHRVTCKQCAAILEYTKSDTRVKTETDYTGDTDYYKVLDCPKCGNIIYT